MSVEIQVPDHGAMPPERFVEALLASAERAGASDLYFIPAAGDYAVRARIAGLHAELASLPREYATQCVARIKVLSGLLTYRTSVSQDGAIRAAEDGTQEKRVAVMPTLHGERLAIRFLQQDESLSHLDDLGMPDAVVAALRRMLKPSAGLIVLTGPTGCGKTTTIYALIRELLRNGHDPSSIISLEDPVEVRIASISQVPVGRQAEWGYAEALKAALRQGVKTLVVGEMRDREVVRVALDAALTGHRIITSYHAGDIASVYARLLHQGFESFLIASAITGIIAQRLVTPIAGGSRRPLVAVLEPTDDWRDFVALRPGLAPMRDRLASMPLADMDAAARGLLNSGIADLQGLD